MMTLYFQDLWLRMLISCQYYAYLISCTGNSDSWISELSQWAAMPKRRQLWTSWTVNWSKIPEQDFVSTGIYSHWWEETVLFFTCNFSFQVSHSNSVHFQFETRQIFLQGRTKGEEDQWKNEFLSKYGVTWLLCAWNLREFSHPRLLNSDISVFSLSSEGAGVELRSNGSGNGPFEGIFGVLRMRLPTKES
jgi:hypothetical protein